MSCREENDLAGVVIDSLKFAAGGDSITGKLPLTRLPRLADGLESREGALECELRGSSETDENGTRLVLNLRVVGRLQMLCQRCLREVDFDCVIDNRLLLVPPGAEWPEDELETDEYDAIPASRELSVASLVEDEVLLALPIAPRHAACAVPDDRASAAVNEESGKPSPFAVLASLKKH